MNKNKILSSFNRKDRESAGDGSTAGSSGGADAFDWTKYTGGGADAGNESQTPQSSIFWDITFVSVVLLNIIMILVQLKYPYK